MVFIFVFFVVLLTSCTLSSAEEKRNESTWMMMLKKMTEQLKKLQFELDRMKNRKCPNGWKLFSDHCYLFVYKPITWMDARTECQNKGGYLVKVENGHEETWLTSELKDEVWLGMNDIQNEGHWRWSDNSFVSYTNWRYSEPNGGRWENCGCYCKNSCYWTSFNWNDRSCSYLTTGYVCEKKR
ncbi:perlucin-like protein isoform X4 [Mytilus californianus]|uniref:perlucin-like protein isoform X4 n=1 Tax=Mytilus californianus TaxID=6549 RepID=UPI0022459215|nr:perlucin-like protein isoform X4 [Mytilus californianus]